VAHVTEILLLSASKTVDAAAPGLGTCLVHALFNSVPGARVLLHSAARAVHYWTGQGMVPVQTKPAGFKHLLFTPSTSPPCLLMERQLEEGSL
jgi:hypothetical protein